MRDIPASLLNSQHRQDLAYIHDGSFLSPFGFFLSGSALAPFVISEEGMEAGGKSRLCNMNDMSFYLW